MGGREGGWEDERQTKVGKKENTMSVSGIAYCVCVCVCVCITAVHRAITSQCYP